METCWKEIKKKRLKSDFLTPHTECSAVVLYSQSTCDLSVAAWPAGERPQGQFIGRHIAGKTQLAGRRPPTLNKPLISTSTYTTSHLLGLGVLHVYLCSIQEMSSPSALIYRMCMQAVVMHVITLRRVFICLWFSPPQEEGSLLPCELQCVFRGRTCIFKNTTLSSLLSCSFPAD